MSKFKLTKMRDSGTSKFQKYFQCQKKKKTSITNADELISLKSPM